MAHSSSITTLPLSLLLQIAKGIRNYEPWEKKHTHRHAGPTPQSPFQLRLWKIFHFHTDPASDPTVIYIPHSLIVFLQNTHISFGFIHLLCFTNDGDAFTALTATLSLILHHRLLLRRFVISKILYYSVTFVFLSSLDFDKYFWISVKWNLSYYFCTNIFR